MAVFPKQEMDVFSLAHAMISGYQTNPGDFPNADLPALQTATEDLRQFLLGVVCFRAMAKIKTEEKDAAFDALVANMTTQLQQAEVDTATALAQPGQARTLEAPRQGEGWIFLDWKEPVDGGAVAAYKIQRRLRPDGPWLDIGLAVESETTLTAQERNKEWEYLVIAVNKAGEGAPSNTVMAVL